MSLSTSQLADIVRGLGGDRVTIRNQKVQCCCLLAPWKHAKGRDRNPSMVVMLEGRHGDPIYTCMSCGEKGSLRDLVLFIWVKTGVDLFHYISVIDGDGAKGATKASEKITKKLKKSFEQGFQVHQEAKKQIPPPMQTVKVGDAPFYDYKCIADADKVPEIPWSVYEPYTGSVPRYAIERGLDLDTCREWELGHDKSMRRLLIPMRDHKGRIVGITGRLYACPKCGFRGKRLSDGERQWIVKQEGDKWGRCASCNSIAPPKYLHSKGFMRNLFLFGENRKKVDRTDGRVYLLEGHLDVIFVWKLGYRPTVGMMGSNPGPAQIEKLIRFYDRVIVVPDGDDAGAKMVRDVKSMVAGRIPVTFKKTPQGTDPGEMASKDPESLKKLLGTPPCSVD